MVKTMETDWSSSSTATTAVTTTTAPSIIDLNTDALLHCANYLNLQDISNLSMSCKFLNKVAYSDSIWQRLYRERWPLHVPNISRTCGARKEYLIRHTSVQQFKFSDPLIADLHCDSKPFGQFLCDKNDVIFSQGSLIHSLKFDSFLSGKSHSVIHSDHRARVTCMRLYPLAETSLFRGLAHRNQNVLVTSSSDHSIRLWWKGSCQRCFRGHNGPVSILSDKLLGGGNEKVLASGGVDGTVRLWSLDLSGKRGKHPLKATLHGHEKSVALMSVAGHRTSLLVSMSKDSKVRVWDTSTSSSARSSCCVGMTSIQGAPVGMRCHESLLYITAGSSVVGIDLRTMQKVFNVSKGEELYSFEILPSKSLICTGGLGRSMLWDTRRSSDTLKAESIAELDCHVGPVTHLHMDGYKIVTAGPDDLYVNVWEAGTGTYINSWPCVPMPSSTGCSGMAVNGSGIVTGGCDTEFGMMLRFRDFSNAICPVVSDEEVPASKFWGLPEDTDESEG